MKHLFLASWLFAITIAIGAIFWHSEWKFQLPTPVPEGYQIIPTGTRINLNYLESPGPNRFKGSHDIQGSHDFPGSKDFSGSYGNPGSYDFPGSYGFSSSNGFPGSNGFSSSVSNKNKPLFIHFFNPDCPCSKFNMPQFRTLAKEHADNSNFLIVVMNNEKYTATEIQEKFKLDIPVSFDTTLATTCGVYSTPQAVILDENSNLYYRGNYNKTRYCTDKKTSYAAMALNALLEKKSSVNFDKSALTAYGCELPTCTK